MHFERSKKFTLMGLEEGSCAWSKRTMRPNEKPVLIFKKAPLITHVNRRATKRPGPHILLLKSRIFLPEHHNKSFSKITVKFVSEVTDSSRILVVKAHRSSDGRMVVTELVGFKQRRATRR